MFGIISDYSFPLLSSDSNDLKSDDYLFSH